MGAIRLAGPASALRRSTSALSPASLQSAARLLLPLAPPVASPGSSSRRSARSASHPQCLRIRASTSVVEASSKTIGEAVSTSISGFDLKFRVGSSYWAWEVVPATAATLQSPRRGSRSPRHNSAIPRVAAGESGRCELVEDGRGRFVGTPCICHRIRSKHIVGLATGSCGS